MELLEVVFDDGDGTLRIEPQDRPVCVRGNAQRAWIAGLDSDAFVRLD